MTDKHDYKTTRERMTKNIIWRDGCTIQDVEAVLSALQIAERLQSGEVSGLAQDEFIENAYLECQWNGDDGYDAHIHHFDRGIKAMATQLLEEIEDGE